VYIAGWKVTNNSITIGNLGEENSFHMYSSGSGTKTGPFGQKSKNWALGIGDKFGVTKNGELYCTGGKIGSMTIDAISNLPN
jgi:hypothetical protein